MTKATGLYVSPTEFVRFAESERVQRRQLAEQIATRQRSPDFSALGLYLPNPELRQRFGAVASAASKRAPQTLFLAGLVGQLQADLAALREEFNLPDVSRAADAELAAEVAQWAKS